MKNKKNKKIIIEEEMEPVKVEKKSRLSFFNSTLLSIKGERKASDTAEVKLRCTIL